MPTRASLERSSPAELLRDRLTGHRQWERSGFRSPVTSRSLMSFSPETRVGQLPETTGWPGNTFAVNPELNSSTRRFPTRADIDGPE